VKKVIKGMSDCSDVAVNHSTLVDKDTWAARVLDSH
jgi:hypothetical protein